MAIVKINHDDDDAHKAGFGLIKDHRNETRYALRSVKFNWQTKAAKRDVEIP